MDEEQQEKRDLARVERELVAYRYESDDPSLLAPYFSTYIAKPCLPHLPWWIPANMITIAGFLSAVTALLVAVLSTRESLHFVLVPALLFFYIWTDIIDGMQAKRTRTSSPLGEYCDHFLDIPGNGITMTVAVVLFRFDTAPIAVVLFASSFLLHVASYYEQLRTGCLRFQKLGHLEGLALTVVLLLLSCYRPFHQLITTALVTSLSPIELLIVPIAFSNLWETTKSLRGVPPPNRQYWSYALFVLVLSTCVLVFETPLLELAACFTLVHLYLGGKVLLTHIRGGELVLGASVLAIGTPVGFLAGAYLAHFPLVLLAYAGVGLGYGALGFYRLRQHWVWRNPPATV